VRGPLVDADRIRREVEKAFGPGWQERLDRRRVAEEKLEERTRELEERLKTLEKRLDQKQGSRAP
jgi:hypothetical protein